MAKKTTQPSNNYRCKDCLHLGKDNPQFLRNADHSPILAECLMDIPYYTNKMRRACGLFKLKQK